jgi:glycosyltransferase involved in cell wall biosynthesis
VKYIVMNSPYLGGAERSIIHQVKNYFGENDKVLVPTLTKSEDTQELISFICETLNCSKERIEVFDFPTALFSVSRSAGVLKSLWGLFYLPFFVQKLTKYTKQADLIWCNGNKVGLPFYLAAKKSGYIKKFIWHFRDYPSRGRLFQKIWDMFGDEKFNFICVGNSKSVQNEIRCVTNNRVNVEKVYNPVGTLSVSPKNIKSPEILGCASMLAPWKGIHEIILCALFFEKELLDLGIKEIHIYGDQIYKTAGEHSNYPQQIKELASRSRLIQFKGKKKPQEIYQSIDLLIHSSIKPEPFGRVITEAFKMRIPVISTGLGGAGELVLNGETGMTYYANHFSSLFESIKTMVQNEKQRIDLITGAEVMVQEIEKDIEACIKNLIN